MMPHHSTLDHHIVHQNPHGSRVRIVANGDVDEAVAALKLLFPHESVHSTPSRPRYTRPASGRRLTSHFRISSVQNGTDASARLTATSSPVRGCVFSTRCQNGT